MSSKRRKGYPSESRVKRGVRIVHGDKELLEKLGRNDPCPCQSGRRFQKLLPPLRPVRRLTPRPLLFADQRAPGLRARRICFTRSSVAHLAIPKSIESPVRRIAPICSVRR
ncbi:MAG: SEC-C metal-binding domain-containing protein [Thermoanaerobaculia bacterium]